MSTAIPPTKPDKTAPNAPLRKAPPEEKFWQVFSPHYEFPLANAAAVALHVLAIVLVIFITTRLMKKEETPAVPVRGQKIALDSAGSLGGNPGSGGAESKKEADDERPQEPQRTIPEAELKKEMVSASSWFPDIKDNPEALKKVVQAPNYEKLNQLNDELKKRIGESLGNKKGTGTGPDTGTSGDGPGPGGSGRTDRPGDLGDPNSSGNRSMRWTILFKTSSGADYLKQLNAFQAKIVIPQPPDWKTNRLFEEITKANPGKALTNQDSLPEMYFVDSDKGSASKVARTLGLEYDPPYFNAYFPKEIENQLAAKEKAYRNRNEKQIYSTTFRVVERNGDFVITVTDQVPTK